jgi:membrane-associated HD superfamily phosphohydrolase
MACHITRLLYTQHHSKVPQGMRDSLLLNMIMVLRRCLPVTTSITNHLVNAIGTFLGPLYCVGLFNTLCHKRFLGTPFMYIYVLAVIVVAVAPVPYLSTLHNI